MGKGITKRELYDHFDEHEGRVRLYRDEIEAIIGALASLRMLTHNVPKLKRVGSIDKKCWQKIRGGFALLEKGLIEYTTRIAVKQYKTISENQGHVSYTHAVHHSQYCMEEEQYWRLVMAARVGICSCCTACWDKPEFQKCELRKVLDCVPCTEGLYERVCHDMGWCPYAYIDDKEYTRRDDE